MSYTISPNMNLSIPTVGVEPGPTYAQDINNSLNAIDQHNHSAGQGTQVNPGGLNINSDLTFNNNNLTNARSLRLSPQAANLALVTDIGCLYESGVDLYYNDGVGNQVRITSGGAVAGSPGSISNLVPPASVSYVSGNTTFIFQSAATTAANIDAGSYILRNLTPSSFGLTLAPPNALAADYTIVLPTLPGTTSVVTLDSSGNMGTQTYNQVGQNMTSVGANAIAASRTRTNGTTVGVGGVAISAGTGTFSTANTAHQPIPGTSVTITTSGRPIMVCLQPDTNIVSSNSNIGGDNSTTGCDIRLTGDTTPQSNTFAEVSAGIRVPPGSFIGIFPAAAGTYTFQAQLAAISVSFGDTASVKDIQLVAYEL